MIEDGGKIVTKLVLETKQYIDAMTRVGTASTAFTTESKKGFTSLAAKMANMASQASKFNKKYSSGMAGNTISTDQFIKKLTLLSGTLRTIAASSQWASNLNNAPLNKVNSAIEGFNRNVGIANTNIGKVTTTSNVFGKQFQMVGGLIDTTGKKFEKVGAASKLFGNKLSHAGTQMAGFETWLRRVGSALGVLLVFAFLGAVKAMIEFSAAMEDAEVKIQSLVGISKELSFKWFKELPGLARDVGAGFTELGDALYYITSAGIRGAETMETLRQVAMASVAGLGEMGTIARTVVSAMNAWGRENISAAMATSTLLNTVKEGQLVATELAGTFSKVMPIASALGVSMQETGAAIAIMSRSGMDAAKATTGLRRLLLALTSPSKQAEEAMNDLGVSSEYFRKVLKGPGGLQEAMMALSYATNAEFEAIDRIIPNLRALTPALTLVKDESGDVVKIFKSLKETKPEDTFEAHAKGAELFSRKLSELRAEFSDLFDLIGSGANDTLIQPIEDLGSVINSLANAVRYYNESDPGKLLQFLQKLMKFGDPTDFVLHPGDSFEASRQAGEDTVSYFSERAAEYKHLRDKYGEFVAAMKFLGSTELKDRRIVIAGLIKASKERDEDRKNDLKGLAEEQRIRAELYEEADRVAKEVADKELTDAQKTLDAANKRKEAADLLAAAKYELDAAIAGGADMAELMNAHAAAYAVAIEQGGGYVTILKKIDSQDAKDATVKRTDALHRATAEIEKAIKEGKTFNKLMRDHAKAMSIVTKGFTDIQPILDKLTRKREADAKATDKQTEAADRLVEKGDEAVALFIAELNALEKLHPVMKDDLKALEDQAMALWETGKGTAWLIERLKELGINVDELKIKWKVNREELDNYQRAAEKAGKTLDKAFESFTSGALQAALTGNFDGVIDSYSTLGEDLAKSLADSFTTAFAAEDSIGSFLEGFLNKDDAKKWSKNITAGVAALSTAYSIYEGARAGEIGVGEGALAGAMMGAQIGSMFPGYGTAIGAVIGAVAGAIIAGNVSESQDQFWIDYGPNVRGGSEVTTTDLDESTINKFHDDLKAVIRLTQKGLLDIAGLFKDTDLLSGINQVFKDFSFMVGGRTADMQTMMETILSDEVPTMLLNRVRGEFAAVFDDLGFGPLFREAWQQMSDMPGDEALVLFQKLSMGVIALTEAMEGLSFGEMIDDLNKTSMDVFQERMAKVFEDIAFTTEKMMNELDLGDAAMDAAEIAQLIKDARQMELEMLARIKQAQDGINANWDAIDRQLALSDMGDSQKFSYYTKELGDALNSLRESTSPEDINKYASQMQGSFQSLMGMVGEEEWGSSLKDLFGSNNPLANDIQSMMKKFGIDLSSVGGFDTKISTIFEMLSAAMREETDTAFDGARDAVEEWADALEQAAIDTAAALNALAEDLRNWREDQEYFATTNPNVDAGDESDYMWWKNPTNWDPLNETLGNIALADAEVSGLLLESSKVRNELLNEYINTPPTVTVNIDGTLEPLIALIDMRIQTANASGGGP